MKRKRKPLVVVIAAVAARCPWCPTGVLSISEGSTVEAWHTGYHLVESGGGMEARERACSIATCNACEFAIEVTRHGMVGFHPKGE